MLRSPRHATVWQIAALAAVGLLYLIPRQHVFTIDSYYYLWDVEFGEWSRLLHPHHLALQPLQRVWWRLWTWFDWPGRAVLPLQLLSLALTLGTLVVVWRLLMRLLGQRRILAAAWWSVVAFSYLTWSQATQTDSLPLFALFAALYLLWAVRLPQDGRSDHRTALSLAAVMAGGVLAHQMLVLATPLLAWMFWREAPTHRRWSLAALSLGTAGGATLVVYLSAGMVATGSAAPGELMAWFLGYSQEFAGRYGSLSNMVSFDALRGVASAFLTGDPLKPYLFGDRDYGLSAMIVALPFVLLGGFLFSRLMDLARKLRRFDPVTRRLVLNVALLAGLTVVFATWWDPGQRKFWAPALVGLVTLLAAGSRPAGESKQSLTVALPTVALAAVLLGYNLAGGILPRHRTHDAVQPLLTFLVRHVDSDDVMVLEEDRVWQAAIYYRPEQRVHGIPGPLSDRGDNASTVFQTAARDAHDALVNGGDLFVVESQWPVLRARLEKDLGPLPEPEILLLYGDWQLGPAGQRLLLVRLPRG